MNILTRGLLSAGDYVRKIQRNYPYPILKKILNYPPIQIAPRKNTLFIPAPPQLFNCALWCAWSWMRYLKNDFSLLIGIDGEIQKHMRDSTDKLFPGAELTEMSELGSEFRMLGQDFQSYATKYRFGSKTASVYGVQLKSNILLSDCDVLAFQRPNIIIKNVQEENQLLYSIKPGLEFEDPWMLEKGKKLKISPVRDLCAGLIYLPKNSMSKEDARLYFGGWNTSVMHWCADQTVFALVAAQKSGKALPPGEYVTSTAGQYFWNKDISYENIVVRHFIGQVRHLMFSRGMKIIESQVKAGIL